MSRNELIAKIETLQTIDATFLIRWAEPTEVPPNFNTFIKLSNFWFYFLYIKSNHERTTFTDFAFDMDRTTMSFHKVLADGKP